MNLEVGMHSDKLLVETLENLGESALLQFQLSTHVSVPFDTTTILTIY